MKEVLPLAAPVRVRRVVVAETAARPALSIGFRCRPDDKIWHFCENCTSWPDAPEPFEEWGGPLPQGSSICEQCLELRKGGNCRLRAASGFSR
jgi:hypothetical protein